MESPTTNVHIINICITYNLHTAADFGLEEEARGTTGAASIDLLMYISIL
jgi:hypothetical protein